MATLSVCLIAKNEEKTIERCLKSILPIADEIIVGDTGSTDKTSTLAEKYGAKVLSVQWEEDFAKARNKTLEHATRDWVLVLDCDEAMEEEEADKLKRLIQQEDETEGYQFKLMNYIDGKIISSAIVLRLFRNRETYRFTGKLHEQIMPHIAEHKGIGSIKNVEIAINHYGYDDKVSSQDHKSKRNLAILTRYKETEKDGYYYYALANEYARIKDNEKAIHYYKRVIQDANYLLEKPVYYAYAVMHLVSVYHQLGYYTEIIHLCDVVEKDLGAFKDLYLSKAFAYHYTGELMLAELYTQKYMRCTQERFDYPSKQYESGVAEQLLQSLEERTLTPCIDACMVVKRDTPTLRESIKILHYIAKEVFVVIEESNQKVLKDLVQQLNHLRITVCYLNEEEMSDVTRFLPFDVRAQWLMMLHDDELLPFSAAPILMNQLQTMTKQGYTVAISDWDTQETTYELRLVKVQEDGGLFVTEDSIEESCIVIYKNYQLDNA